MDNLDIVVVAVASDVRGLTRAVMGLRAELRVFGRRLDVRDYDLLRLPDRVLKAHHASQESVGRQLMDAMRRNP